MRALLLFLLGLSTCAAAAGRLYLTRPALYSGLCDASAGISVTSNLFLVACDENNTLRLYRTDQGGPPVKQFNFDSFLQVEGKSLEADLEGAARIGDRVFWIGSHGRNWIGKERFNRSRLFATNIRVTDGQVTLTPVGRPCKRLFEDLVTNPAFAKYHLAEASTRPPKDTAALDLEGLSATPEGHLLIGFRNPIPKGKALLIPLLNPNEVIEDKPAQFGPAIRLDLAGLGIRDIACYNGTYLIIAGPYDGRGHFRIYRWAGPGTDPEHLKVDGLNDYHPEGIIIYPEKGLQEIQILSDDGTREFNGVPCKQLGSLGRFRSFWLSTSPP